METAAAKGEEHTDPLELPEPQRLLKQIDQAPFVAVALQAREPRWPRWSLNLHQESDPVQSFLNMLQPGTDVLPHCHLREQGGR